MVKAKILSRYTGEVPESDSFEHRKIRNGGPLYPRQEVIDILADRAEGTLRPITQRCRDHLLKYSMDEEDAARMLVSCLGQARYLNSQWCKQGNNGPWTACDSYVLLYKEWNADAYKYLDVEYYVKLAISKSGKVILLNSCHPSDN